MNGKVDLEPQERNLRIKTAKNQGIDYIKKKGRKKYVFELQKSWNTEYEVQNSKFNTRI
jgi:hypothetical protein